LASFNLAHHLAITFERETKLASEVTIDADCNVNDNRTLLSKVKAFDTRQNRAMSIRKQSSLKKSRHTGHRDDTLFSSLRCRQPSWNAS